MVAASVAELAPAFLTPSGEWGAMEHARWAAFTQWLSEKGVARARAAPCTADAGTTRVSASA